MGHAPSQRNGPGREYSSPDPRAGSVFRRPGKPQRPGLHHDRGRPATTRQRRCTAVLPGSVRSGCAALPAGAAAPPRHAAGRARRHPGRRPTGTARHLAGYARRTTLLRHPPAPPGGQRFQAGPLPHHPDERCHRPPAGHRACPAGRAHHVDVPGRHEPRDSRSIAQRSGCSRTAA